MNMPIVAVVVPCFQSGPRLGELTDRVLAALACHATRIQLVFVDDASPGEWTWSALLAQHAAHPENVQCIRLAGHVGQHRAIECGLHELSADVEIVVTMDDDLQHQPEDVPSLIAAVQGGADLAIGAYATKRHSHWRNLAGRALDHWLRNIRRLPRHFQLTSLRAMRRQVADRATQHPARFRYLTAALLEAADCRVNVQVQHLPRRDGRSGYSLAKSLALVANLLLGHAHWPIYCAVGSSALLLVSVGVCAAWICYYPGSNTLPIQLPWAWLVIDAIVVLGLVVIASVATIATYQSRTTTSRINPWRVADRR